MTTTQSDDVAHIRSLLALAKADGWHHFIYGFGWSIEHVWESGNQRVSVDADGLRVHRRIGTLAIDWLPVLNVSTPTAQQATDYLAVLGIVPVHMSSAYGRGAVEAIVAAKEAMVQGLAPRLENAIREEITAVAR